MSVDKYDKLFTVPDLAEEDIAKLSPEDQVHVRGARAYWVWASARAKELFEMHLAELEALHRGKFVCILVESREVLVDENQDRLTARQESMFGEEGSWTFQMPLSVQS